MTILFAVLAALQIVQTTLFLYVEWLRYKQEKRFDKRIKAMLEDLPQEMVEEILQEEWEQ